MILVHGEDIGLLEDKIIELTNNKFTKLVLDANFDDIYLKFSQRSLFDDFDSKEDTNNEIYVIYDFNKLLGSSRNEDSNKTIELLEFLKSTNDKIIFLSNVKEVSKVYAKLFEVISVKKLNKLTIKNYCYKLLKQHELFLQQNEFNCLIELLQPDSLLIKNEIDKLSLVSEKITTGVIKKIISVDINKNVFELIDNFFNKNYEKIIKQITVLENNKVDFTEVFNIMVAQLFFLKLYRLSYLKNRSYKKICSDFNVQLFQIEKWEKLILSVNVSEIDIFLNNLLKLNILFLSGKKNLPIYLKMILLNGGEYGI